MLVVKNPPANAGDLRDICLPPGEGHSNPLQYSCLENPTDRGVWQATVHRVAKSRIGLSNQTTITKQHELQHMCIGSLLPIFYRDDSEDPK